MKNLKTYVTAVVLALFLAMGCIIAIQKGKINSLKIENAVNAEKVRVLKNNATVLAEKARYWQTKDSINVVTVGLLNADKELFKGQYSDLDKKFNNLVLENNKKVTRNAYLESQITIKDGIIASLSKDKPGGPSYIKDDSTIIINDDIYVDARNYRKTTGSITIGIDSNKINKADINLSTEQSIGVDLALYKDANGIDRVSAGTKYPNANLNINGIVDIEQRMKDYKTISEANNKKKGRIGIGLNLGYGFSIRDNTIVRSPYIGVGFNYNIIRLK